MSTLTLAALAESARSQGHRADVIGTGGNVMALSLVIDGAELLLSLADGAMTGDTWQVSTDGATRATVGDRETDELPVTSDADQTVADAVAWVRHVVWGDALDGGEGDGHMPGCGCAHRCDYSPETGRCIECGDAYPADDYTQTVY